MKLSIIIPVFNAEGTIKESIKSASNQTISDLEIICIDNNSTDNSVLLIKKLQERDNRIILFHEDSQGAGPARNRGIHESTGEFIFFLDPDDAIFSENTLERLYNLAKKYKKNIVGGSVFIHDPIKKEEQINTVDFFDEILKGPYPMPSSSDIVLTLVTEGKMTMKQGLEWLRRFENARREKQEQ